MARVHNLSRSPVVASFLGGRNAVKMGAYVKPVYHIGRIPLPGHPVGAQTDKETEELSFSVINGRRYEDIFNRSKTIFYKISAEHVEFRRVESPENRKESSGFREST